MPRIRCTSYLATIVFALSLCGCATPQAQAQAQEAKMSGGVEDTASADVVLAAIAGDAHDRLLAQLERIRVEVGGATPDRADGGSAQESADKLTVPWAVVPDLVTGLELGTVRLAVASLDLGSHPAVREVGHV